MSQEIIGNIRCTEMEEISVMDLIKAIGGYENPEIIWQNISQNYPDIAQQCKYYSFDDYPPELTLVTDQKTALKIIDLLPNDFQITDWQGAIKFLENKIK